MAAAPGEIDPDGNSGRKADRPFGLRKRAATGAHEFDRLCTDLEAALMRYAHLDNSQLPQTTLKAKTPMLDMKEQYDRKPESFRKRPYYQTGCDFSPAP